jgi:hypothetical protein
MHTEKKEAYVQPALVTHELLRDITARSSGRHANNGFGNGGNDGVPGNSNHTDSNR